MRFTERCFFSCCYLIFFAVVYFVVYVVVSCYHSSCCCLNVCLNSYFQQNREGVASKVHRQGTIDGLKKFNARRKLKVCQLGKYFIENRNILLVISFGPSDMNDVMVDFHYWNLCTVHATAIYMYVGHHLRFFPAFVLSS